MLDLAGKPPPTEEEGGEKANTARLLQLPWLAQPLLLLTELRTCKLSSVREQKETARVDAGPHGSTLPRRHFVAPLLTRQRSLPLLTHKGLSSLSKSLFFIKWGEKRDRKRWGGDPA